MCLTAFIACSGNGNDDVTTPAGDGTTPEETPAQTTDPSQVQSDQTSADLNEAIIKFLVWEDSTTIEFEYDETALDNVIINEAVRDKNVRVEARLNCDLQFIKSKGDYDNQQVFLQKAQSFANGDEGEFVDAYASYSMTTALLSTKGLCANLMPLQSENGLNFNHPWWPKKLVDQAMFKDRLYVCTGDISTNLLWNMQTFFFNKELAEDYNIPAGEFYKLVDEGKWTIDKFYEYCANRYVDHDGDGRKSDGDEYGYTTSSNVFFDDFYVGAGFQMVVKDSEGNIALSETWGNEQEDAFTDKLAEFVVSSKDGYWIEGPAYDIFYDSRALFYNNRSNFAKRARENCDFNYGILPTPKLNEIQEDYATCLGFPYTLYAVSASSSQKENVAVVLESLAAQSYEVVTPAVFYDALQLRYSPEVDDARMFQIIKDTTAFDVGRIYTTPLQNMSFNIFRNCIAAGSTHYSIQCQAKRSSLNILIEALMRDLLAAPN